MKYRRRSKACPSSSLPISSELSECPLPTQADIGVYLRGSERSSIAALAGLAGALSTAAQAGGKSLSFRPRAEPPNSGIFKRRIQSTNQWSSDLSHASPPGTGGCARQSGESAGHLRSTWMWSAWPYQGRTLDIQAL